MTRAQQKLTTFRTYTCPLWLVAVLIVGALYLGVLASASLEGDPYPWIHIFGGIATCLALFLSILESKRLTGIHQSLSTRVVGNFPDNVPHITSLLGEAKGQILIVCDSPAYGFFSNRRAYLDYRHKLQTLADDDVNIKMVAFDRERSIGASRAQFGSDIDKIRELDSYKQYFSGTDSEPQTAEEFFEYLESKVDRERDVFASLLTETNGDIPLYFWLVDGREAVFSFPTLRKRPPEVAFRTSDKWLIEIFKDIEAEIVRDAAARR